ncbi:tyrosine-type recombinase/integrase [Bacillus sp. V3B]|uniref:tyrosine-type recombinase/integrase n=1 Tax=Bacillus sp. V3B TaxID=2804915 RepID=UPI00210DF91E|nr:tyrosine-type recombinase/integrase [Bacillus sp. V3B]MCQ6273944.1 tyrosine-type recombinase/integrase [Bacillus sp. V3B]
MEYVNPIKDVEQINAIKVILQKQSQRDLLLFVLGINTGVKISDLLFLKVEDVWDGTQMKEFLYIKDEKSEEKQAFYLNSRVEVVLETYLSRFNYSSKDFLFKSKKNDQPITRQQAYRIINHAAKEAGIIGKIGTHTLRKTFGYHALRKGIAISILMSIYHHQSPAETLRYLGVDKYEKHLIKVDVNL